MNAPYQAIRCADGYITLGAANERLFRRLCEVLGHPGVDRRSPEFARQREPRAASRARSRERIEAVTPQRRASHWLALLRRRTTFRAGRSTTTRRCSPIRRSARASMVVETDHPTLGRIRTLGSPIKMSDTPPDRRPPRAAPRRAHGRDPSRGRVLHRRRSRTCDHRRGSADAAVVRDSQPQSHRTTESRVVSRMWLKKEMPYPPGDFTNH